ncbi:ferritin-like domain-containing protein [Pedobacter psychroterrae]|uniref:Ferritin-like domain-containing protein n=1 Tax=Pedobacter psychroterrae TaxID=2530453 RepID=A0A4R0NPS0_9SPHI|nr:ferritin-like domain-containing protein [Pedobacter psychroterrae]TCD01094.1 ferritin-like domain-containing protein [Pedobacter psychroterrae]
MNIVNILEEIEKVDGEVYERLNPRRAAMKSFVNMGKKVSLAAVPLALGSMFQKAYGQTLPTAVKDVLNFALTLEYLEYHFYNHAVLAAPGLLSGAALTAISTIRDHELAHVNLLKGALGATDARPALAYTDFDFTAGGTFGDVYTNYNTFLAVAQAFEDTGVRAYKGQAGVLKGLDVLTTALQIHSVEARHAAHIRTMRGQKPWITLGAGGVANDTGIAAVDAVYAGENEEMQTGVTITGIATGVTKAAAVESFDEPLDKAKVLVIAGLFIR